LEDLIDYYNYDLSVIENAMEVEQAKGSSPELVETELVLPSGTRIGHRDFNVYYRQSLRPLDVSPYFDKECSRIIQSVS
jgi:hypothetical protein